MEKAASGAFSRVYRAFDAGLNRNAAVKVFRLSAENVAGLPYDVDEWRRRFVAEARFLAAFNHPHVVRVDDFGWLDPETPYMVMPWHPANLRGEIGRDVFDSEKIAALPVLERPRALPWRRAQSVLRQLCSALAALHRAGAVHRDVKPTNILLTRRGDGEIRLCDFGMVRTRNVPIDGPLGGQGLSGGSRAGVWIGTREYMAPEQREDASRVDEKADVYALGATAYRVLTGKAAIGAFPPPSSFGGGIETWMDEWVFDAMAPDPVKRPSATSLALRMNRRGLDSEAAKPQS